MLRHRSTIDFTKLTPAQRKVLQPALDACDYPLSRIRRTTHRRVPVTAADLSRFAAALGKSAHVHVHDAHGNEGHLLGMPYRGRSSWSEKHPRAAALGLYWLPTPAAPAGRIELDLGAFRTPDLAREVLLAELAHAVDYGVPMTDAQRIAIMGLYTADARDPDGTDDWFDEHGETDYWSWIGESFMSGFMRAFAPGLPRPLEAQQPWVHKTTDRIAAGIRQLLK